MRVVKHWNMVPRYVGISISRDIQKLSGHSTGQPARGDPACAQGVD